MSEACCCSQKDIYLPETATVVKSEQMTEMERYFQIQLGSGDLGHKPGQFVEVYVPVIGEAPISVSSPPGENGSFELVVRKMGRVTGALHGLEAGAQVGIRGPFGTHFPVDGVMKGKDVLFVCGGIGLVPVRSAIKHVLDNRDDYGEVTLLYGTKTADERLFKDELAEWHERTDVVFFETVDRGHPEWGGNVGVITTLMPLIKIDPENTIVIVCGPPIMYKFVLVELTRLNVSHENTYVSLERHMKCGVGKCGHCQINGIYACQDGPVFKYADIEGVEEAI